MTSTTYLNLQTVAEPTSVTTESRRRNKKLKPYWNDVIAQKSMRLWLPLDLNLSQSHLNSKLKNSWFSTSIFENSSNQITLKESLISDEVIIKQRSKKIRVYPTSEQKQILKQWFGVCRFFYNKTLHDLNYKNHDIDFESSMHQTYLEPKYPTTNYIDEARRIFANVPEWSKDVPYQSKRLAIKQCCDAVKNAKIKYKKSKKIQKLKFKSKKNTKESIYIPKSAVSQLGIYHTKLGILKFAEPVGEAKYDCRLLIDNGQYFLIMPYDKVIPKLENQRLGIVALDSGVRTFQTFYNPVVAGKIGNNDFNRVFRLCYAMDKLIAKSTKVNSKKRKNMKKALSRIRIKIKNIISEIHHKSDLFFAKNFDTVVIPPFETSII